MKSKFTFFWTAFFGLLVWTLLSAFFSPNTILTITNAVKSGEVRKTVVKKAGDDNPVAGDTGGEDCGGCHSAGGAVIAMDFENFPTEIEPGGSYEIKSYASVFTGVPDLNQDPSIQTVLYSETGTLKIGKFLTELACVPETDNVGKKHFKFPYACAFDDVLVSAAKGLSNKFVFIAANDLQIGQTIFASLGERVNASDVTDEHKNWGCAQIKRAKMTVVKPSPKSDLELSLTCNNPNPVLNTVIEYNLTVKNKGVGTAKSIKIKAPQEAMTTAFGLTPTSQYFTKGYYSPTTQEWQLDSLRANESTSLLIRVKVRKLPLAKVFAQIIAQSGAKESDSVPNNAEKLTPQEDDEAVWPAFDAANAKPDFALANVQPLAPISRGGAVWFEFDILNLGDFGTKSCFDVFAFLDSDLTKPISKMRVCGLPLGGRPRFEGVFVIQENVGLGGHQLILKADASNGIVEKSESNNSISVPINVVEKNSGKPISIFSTGSRTGLTRAIFGSNDWFSGLGDYSENFFLDRHLQKGVPINLSFFADRRVGDPNLSNDFFVRVWADLNRNNVFEENEKFFDSQGQPQLDDKNTDGIINRRIFKATGALTIPTNVANGAMRFRVATKNGSFPKPIETNLDGEIEDYIFNVVDVLKAGDRETKIVEKQEPVAFNIFPSPAETGATIDLSELLGKAVDVQVFNLKGQPVFAEKIKKLEQSQLDLDVSRWESGIYLVQIQSPGRRSVTKRMTVMRL